MLDGVRPAWRLTTPGYGAKPSHCIAATNDRAQLGRKDCRCAIRCGIIELVRHSHADTGGFAVEVIGAVDIQHARRVGMRIERELTEGEKQTDLASEITAAVKRTILLDERAIWTRLFRLLNTPALAKSLGRYSQRAQVVPLRCNYRF